MCVGVGQHVTNVWNSDEPKIGSIVIFNAGWYGHVGVVIRITEDSIIVRSRNWLGKYIVSDDEFKLDDERILGYII